MEQDTPFDADKFSSALRRERARRNLSLDDVAKETSVSKSTLSRIERGSRRPSTNVIARVTRWLNEPVTRYLKSNGPQPVTYYPDQSTPAIVRAHLEADPTLTPQAAAALAELFDVAYRQFAKG